MSRSIPIIIDCDPGVDDAIALLAAFASPELDIRAIQPVCGNQPLERTLRNALRIRELGGRPGIPVYPGCWRPLLRDPLHGEFHGETGLGSARLPDPIGAAEPISAVEHLIKALEQSRIDGDKITLCCLGPLTNLAVALRMRPEIVGGIARVVMMGGAYREPGNRTMTSEFNVLADPHAARIVFASDLPIVALGLDATHQVILRPEHTAEFAHVSGRISRPLSELMKSWDRNDPRRYGSRGGPLHDPLVIAWLLRPDLFETERARVFVETDSPLCMGQTVADWYGKSGMEPNVDIVTRVDAEGVLAVLLERFARYGQDETAT